MGWADVRARAPRSAQVLVVEDNAGIRKSIVQALEGLGHQVTAAPTAEDGEARLLEGGIDVALFDIELPGISGVELLGRSLEHTPELPVIMLTGVTEMKVALDCLDKGARTYLLKPLELGILEWAVTDALALRALLADRNDMVQESR